MTVLNFIRKHLGLKMVYKDPYFVKKYCKGKGLEIGGAAYNEFKINALNVDVSDHLSEEDVYTREQIKHAGYVKKVDIIAQGYDIPVEDSSVDFVISSHVIEHFYDPIAAIYEWQRVVKNGGYIVIIAPHKERTFDKDRECSTLSEIEERHKNFDKTKVYPDKHYTVCTTESFTEVMKHYNFNVVEIVDEVYRMQNSFAIIIKVRKESE